MREIVTIQVGQCGNQIGNQFWSQMLQEHEKTPDNDDALSAFFRFAPQKEGGRHVMKARALLIDMECGPLQQTMKSPLGSLFDEAQFVMDVYGAGNNFAHGHCEYGPKYRDKFEEGLRRNAEHCDSLQTFIVTHSLSGGTGSGVGTYILGLLSDLYPEIYRFSACVFPSDLNDVVTSSYNSVLATKQLMEHADCVLPMDNRALQSFVALETTQRNKKKIQTIQKEKKGHGFDEMNGVAARMLCHLTSSSRFHGEMNIDLNEICTNVVPFPRLHFLMSALSPQRAFDSTGGSSSSGGKNALQRAFTDLLSHNGQLHGADPQTSGCVTVASAFIARGSSTNVRLSDFLSCVVNAQKSLRFPSWNQDACKIGICNTPSPGENMSVMGIYNSTAFNTVITRERDRFNKIFKRKAMLHHYLEFMEEEDVVEAEKWSKDLSAEYQELEDSLESGKRYSDNEQSNGRHGLKTPVLFPEF
jgi:tubulin epsilon